MGWQGELSKDLFDSRQTLFVRQRLDKQLCVQENRMRQNQSQDKVVRKARKGNSLDGRLGRVNKKKQTRSRDPLKRVRGG